MAKQVPVAKDQVLQRWITPEFKQKIIPSQIMCYFDPRFLLPEEESKITARETQCGAHDAAALMLDLIARKPNWFNVLVKTLKRTDVKMGHVATEFENIYAQVTLDCANASSNSPVFKSKTASTEPVKTFSFGPEQSSETKNMLYYETDAGREKNIPPDALTETYDDARSMDDITSEIQPNKSNVELRTAILEFLTNNPSPQKVLNISKACNCVLRKDVNPVLYNLQREGLIKKCSEKPPTWEISGTYSSLCAEGTSHVYEPYASEYSSAVGDSVSPRSDRQDQMSSTACLAKQTGKCYTLAAAFSKTVTVDDDVNTQANEQHVGGGDSAAMDAGTCANTASRTSTRTKKSSSQKEKNFTREEVTSAFQRLTGWRSNITDKEVVDLFNEYMIEDGSYILWFWERKSRPAISVIYHEEIVTFVIHKRKDQVKNVYYVAKDQKVCTTLDEVITFHIVNGIKDTRKDRKTYGQNIPLYKPL